MTRTLRTDAVEVELGRGWWRARWASGETAGPFTVARTTGHGDAHRADAGAGAWRLEIGARGASPGSWARWQPGGTAPGFSVHVPADGPLVVVEARPDAPDAQVAVLVAAGEAPGPPAPGVAVATGNTSGTQWAALAAGPDAAALVSATQR